jgi:hypothetical protein
MQDVCAIAASATISGTGNVDADKELEAANGVYTGPAARFIEIR